MRAIQIRPVASVRSSLTGCPVEPEVVKGEVLPWVGGTACERICSSAFCTMARVEIGSLRRNSKVKPALPPVPYPANSLV